MKTEVFTMSNEDCQESSGTVGGTEMLGYSVGGRKEDYHDRITENMICAEDVTSGSDSCQGDSGGPMIIPTEGGYDLQVGIVSWGVSCAHKDFPGVYAKIAAQYEWIRETVCQESSNAPSYFECDTTANDRAVESQVSLNPINNDESWTTIVTEDFTNGLGLFDRRGPATVYTSAMDRAGVVRLAVGQDKNSAIKSSAISLENSPFTRLRINFAYFAMEMKHTESICLDYKLDEGSVTGEKCWSSIESGSWSEDSKIFEFAASNAKNLMMRLRVEGDENSDDGMLLIDSVTLQGLSSTTFDAPSLSATDTAKEVALRKRPFK